MSNSLNSLNKWLQDTIFKPLEDKKMPVMEHLVELQVRLTRAVIITAVVFVGTFFYADMLVKWLRIPLQNMFRPGSLSWVPTICRPFHSSFSRRLKRYGKTSRWPGSLLSSP